MDISSGEEPARQEDPTLEAPKNPATAVNPLVNLQDPILKTPESLATTVNTLVNLQELQEPIVTSSAINPSPERMHLQEPIATSSAINPSPPRVRLQEPIVTSSAITPSPEQVCFITELFASSFPCAVLIFYLLSESKPLGVALFDPASVGSAILEVDDHQPQPTGVAS
jgi:hypothetical protein